MRKLRVEPDIVVTVPGLKVPEVNLHHPSPAFHKTQRSQTSSTEIRIAIPRAERRLSFEISNTSGASDCMRKATSIGLDARFQFRLMPDTAQIRSDSPYPAATIDLFVRSYCKSVLWIFASSLSGSLSPLGMYVP